MPKQNVNNSQMVLDCLGKSVDSRGKVNTKKILDSYFLFINVHISALAGKAGQDIQLTGEFINK